MSEVTVENSKERKLDKIKAVVRKNWKPFTVGVVFTGVTFVVTRRVTLRYFPTNVMRINKMVIKDSVFFFQTYGRKQGPPSYVIRCVETGEIFTSQAEACRKLGLDPSTLSRHLNGYPGNATIGGKAWKRAAISAPRSM
jgi:hypothetical protein